MRAPRIALITLRTPSGFHEDLRPNGEPWWGDGGNQGIPLERHTRFAIRGNGCNPRR